MTMSFIVYGSVAAVSLVLLYVIVSLFKTPPAEDQNFSRESEIVTQLDEELKIDLHEKEALIEDLRISAELKAGEVDKILREKDELREEIDKLRGERDEQGTACAALQDELRANKESLTKKIGDAEIQYQRKIESLKEELSILQNQKNDAEARYGATEEQVLSLRSEIESSQEALGSIKKVLDEERVSYSRLVPAIKEKGAVIDDLTHKVITATRDVSRLNSDRSTLSDELESAKKALEEERVSCNRLALVIKEKDAAAEDLSRKVVAATNDRLKLSSDKAALSKELELVMSDLMTTKNSMPKRADQARVEERILSLRSEIESSQEALGSIKKVLDEERASYNKLALVIKEKDAVVNELTHKVVTATKDVSRLNSDKVSLNEELKSAKKTLEGEKTSCARLASVVKEKDAAVENLNSKVVAATNELLKVNSNRATISKELESVKRELMATKNSMPKRVNRARVVLQRVISTLKNEREDLLRQNEEFNKQLACANNDIARISNRLEDSRRNLDEAKRNVRHSLSDKEIEAVKEENVMLVDMVQSIRRELAGVYDSMSDKVKNARAVLQEELDAVRMENADLQSQNVELEKQMQFFKEESQLIQDSLKDSDEKKTEFHRLMSDAESADDITSREL